MITLLKLVGFHVLRARILYLILALGVALQWGGLKIASAVNVQVNTKLVQMEASYFTFFSLISQLFVGSFVAIVFGLWFLPYLHQGARAQLTYVMPVRKWMYPVVYAIVLVPLIALLSGITGFALHSVSGSLGTTASAFLWCLALQMLAFEVVMLGFGLGAVVMGPISSFFLGAILLAALQGACLLRRINILTTDSPSAFWRSAARLYALLPPLGEIPFQLWEQMTVSSPISGAWLSWVLWILLLGTLLVLQLRFRPHVR